MEIREHLQGKPVQVVRHKDRWVLKAYNEDGFAFTLTDLIDVVKWVKINRPDLMKVKTEG